jgi:hypothetical protein
MAKHAITKSEYLQMEGLAVLAQRHSKMVVECEEAMEDVLGLPRNSGETGDVSYGDRDIRWLLERLQIEVES